MTALARHIMQPEVTGDHLDKAFDRDFDLATAPVDDVARIRLVLDSAKKLIEQRRDAATTRLKGEVEARGPFVAASREFYLKAPGYKDVCDTRQTFAALRKAGVSNDQIFDALQFNPAAVRTLCEVFNVDYEELLETGVVKRNEFKQALGMRKA